MESFAECRLGSLRIAVVFVTLASSGCALIDNSRGPNLLASSVNAKDLASSQASLALDRAVSAENQGELDDAIRYYEQARALDPKLDHLSRRLAVLYDQRGDDAPAQAAYERAVQLQPSDPDLLNDFGVFHLHRERWAAAESWFRRSLAIDPSHQRAANNLAMSLAMQNRLSESYEVFSGVVGPAAAYSNLGVLLARQGKRQEAREHFQHALSLDGTIRTAGEFLGWLDRSSESTGSPGSPSSVVPASYEQDGRRL